MEADELREALISLIEWIPEFSEPTDFTEISGYPKEMIDRGEMPFLSESFLYIVLGKDDARSLLARVRRVIKAAGYSDDSSYLGLF